MIGDVGRDCLSASLSEFKPSLLGFAGTCPKSVSEFHQDASPMISKALSESVILAEMGKHSWVADLRTTISSFSDGSLALPDLRTAEADAIAALIKKIERLSLKKLQLEIDSLPKAYLLRNRLEPDNDGVLSQRVACFRHYLHIQNAQHRQALTRILCACHLLAVEKLSWSERYRLPVPCHLRLCRFCQTYVEMPEHALFQCPHNELLHVRATFLSRVQAARPTLQLPEDDCLSLFHRTLENRSTAHLARLCFHILRIYDAKPILIPDGFIVNVQSAQSVTAN